MIPSKRGEDTDADSYPTHNPVVLRCVCLWNSRSRGKVKPQPQQNYAQTQ